MILSDHLLITIRLLSKEVWRVELAGKEKTQADRKRCIHFGTVLHLRRTHHLCERERERERERARERERERDGEGEREREGEMGRERESEREESV